MRRQRSRSSTSSQTHVHTQSCGDRRRGGASEAGVCVCACVSAPQYQVIGPPACRRMAARQATLFPPHGGPLQRNRTLADAPLGALRPGRSTHHAERNGRDHASHVVAEKVVMRLAARRRRHLGMVPAVGGRECTGGRGRSAGGGGDKSEWGACAWAGGQGTCAKRINAASCAPHKRRTVRAQSDTSPPPHPITCCPPPGRRERVGSSPAHTHALGSKVLVDLIHLLGRQRVDQGGRRRAAVIAPRRASLGLGDQIREAAMHAALLLRARTHTRNRAGRRSAAAAALAAVGRASTQAAPRSNPPCKSTSDSPAGRVAAHRPAGPAGVGLSSQTSSPIPADTAGRAGPSAGFVLYPAAAGTWHPRMSARTCALMLTRRCS